VAPLPFEEAHFALALALLGALVAPPLLLGLTRLLVRDRDGFAYAAGGVASASLAFAAVLAILSGGSLTFWVVALVESTEPGGREGWEPTTTTYAGTAGISTVLKQERYIVA